MSNPLIVFLFVLASGVNWLLKVNHLAEIFLGSLTKVKAEMGRADLLARV
jgi:hypothetical protein